MIRKKLVQPIEEQINPFTFEQNIEILNSKLEYIENKQLRTKFKCAQDPITLAFQTIDRAPLKVLAKDFITESFEDIVSFVTKICR